MKKLYFLDEEEKQRILSIHESATKRHYLGEQAASSEWLPDPTKNPNWEYQFKDNKWFARKKNNPTQEYDISKDTKYASSIKKLNDAYPKGVMSSVKTDTNTDPNKTVQDTTKKIQALLGLEQTGNMDSGLLQKINDKLNGKSQEAPKSVVAPPAAGTSGISGTVAGVSGISGPVASSTTGTPTAAVGPQFNSKSFPEIKGYTPTTPTLR